jgi:hypothetical protein
LGKLTENQEAVVVAVKVMTRQSELPTPGMLGLIAEPPLTTAEVMLTAGELIHDGLLRMGDFEGLTYYMLTGSGDQYATHVASRGS